MIKYIVFIVISVIIYYIAYEEGYEEGRRAELEKWQMRNMEAFLRWYRGKE